MRRSGFSIDKNTITMIQDYFSDCTTMEQLEKKHRTLVLQLHPDRNPDNPNATREFQEMQSQYEERKAELNGDYSGSRKARERRERAEREEREREERERMEREAHRVEEVIKEARLTTATDYHTWKAGMYVYAHMVVQDAHNPFDWDYLSGDDVVRVVFRYAVNPEVVVKIETIIELGDTEIMNSYLSNAIGGIYGGYEILQSAGMTKGKRVPKVVMFRSPHYCFFGNPMGDQVISDYYVPVGFDSMFSDQIHRLFAEQQRLEEERKRIEAERMAKLEAEQKPLIEKWSGKLITISAALTDNEKQTVAVNNMKKLIHSLFPGTTFKVKKRILDGQIQVQWEDGATFEEVQKVIEMFCSRELSGELTPWEIHYGRVPACHIIRSMSTITKAKILEQLADIVPAFATKAYDDIVTLDNTSWMMLHLMVGMTLDKDGLCEENDNSTNDHHNVFVCEAVQYIFDHTSYVRPINRLNRYDYDSNIFV